MRSTLTRGIIGTNIGFGRRGCVGQNLEEMPQCLVLDHPFQCSLIIILATVVTRVLAISSWTNGHGRFVEPCQLKVHERRNGGCRVAQVPEPTVIMRAYKSIPLVSEKNLQLKRICGY